MSEKEWLDCSFEEVIKEMMVHGKNVKHHEKPYKFNGTVFKKYDGEQWVTTNFSMANNSRTGWKRYINRHEEMSITEIFPLLKEGERIEWIPKKRIAYVTKSGNLFWENTNNYVPINSGHLKGKWRILPSSFDLSKSLHRRGVTTFITRSNEEYVLDLSMKESIGHGFCFVGTMGGKLHCWNEKGESISSRDYDIVGELE